MTIEEAKAMIMINGRAVIYCQKATDLCNPRVVIKL